MWSSEPPRRRCLRALLLPVALAPAACGFRLRGSAELPFETLFVSFPPASATGAEFVRLLRVQGGTRLVDKATDAHAPLEVHAERRAKGTLGFHRPGPPPQ